MGLKISDSQRDYRLPVSCKLIIVFPIIIVVNEIKEVIEGVINLFPFHSWILTDNIF
jgi:hypothetical protein